jgi:hypothetical protein
VSSGAPQRLLLGPQRPDVYLRDAIEAAGIEAGSFATITAGWQEAENDIDDVRAAVGRPLTDLELYGHAESLFAEIPELHAAYRQRQERLREQQRLYRLRLRPLASAARHVLRENGHPEIAEAEQRHAISQLRALDRHHLRATEAHHQDFETAWQHDGNRPWRRRRDEIAARLDESEAVLIAGGNIIVLLNRMRLFGLAEQLAGKTVVGWSAGAMVLAPRIVLFHDRMPQGPREPEVLGAGFGLIANQLVLPDAAYRLGQGKRLRLGLMARRFSPHTCLALDNRQFARFDGDRLARVDGARRITRNGRLAKVKAT